MWLFRRNEEPKEELKVATNSNYVVWMQDISHVPVNSELFVDPGCIAVYLVDGNMRDVKSSGKYLVKEKTDKHARSLQLICANTSKTFQVQHGVGRIPYHDYEINVDAEIGCYANSKVSISNPWQLYLSMGKEYITEAEVKEYLRKKTEEIIVGILAKTLQRYDYITITTQQRVLSENMKKDLSEYMISIGVLMHEFALGGFQFGDDFLDKREEYYRRKEEDRARQAAQDDEDRRRRGEIIDVIELNNAMNNALPSRDESQRKCPYCGCPVNAGELYCSLCGRKL